MSNHLALSRALADLASNHEQRAAVRERGHCVVLAGPGSGKTKTLTTAMARVLIEDVVDPRGVACITYNNECTIELETRLAVFGIEGSGRNFIGTVHSFALTQVIMPYARCIAGLLPAEFRVATRDECRAAVEVAYAEVFDDQFDPHARWQFAEEKRRREVDRALPGWRGRNPELLQGLVARPDIREVRLRFNYRSGAKIIRASLGALGEERDYRGVDAAPEGDLFFWKVKGDLDAQASTIASQILTKLLERHPAEEVAILYRAAWLGDKLAGALDQTGIAYMRTDGNALVKRSSRLARLVEGCAAWVAGGWRDADPSFARLLTQTKAIVYGGRCSEAEEQALSGQLIAFLRSGIDSGETTHAWLQRLFRELIAPWRALARNPHQEWDVCAEMIEKTDPARGRDMALNIFAGRMEGTGRVSLSTLHSAKGREFDAVILFGMNAGDIPSRRDEKSAGALREARRLFYVGVTRPRKELAIVYREGAPSTWVVELYKRSQQS